jgi:small subunit ribosomal protein S21
MAKAINLEVKVRKGEPFERAIRRFTRKVKKEKIIEEYIGKQRYEKSSVRRHRRRRLVDRKRKQEKEQNNN